MMAIYYVVKLKLNCMAFYPGPLGEEKGPDTHCVHISPLLSDPQGQSNYIISFLSIHFYTFMRAGGNYSLFIVQCYGILRVWLPGTAQTINKKEAWLVF